MNKVLKTLCHTPWMLIFLLIMFLSILSCGKVATENKLVGRWHRINIDNLDDTTSTEDWEFLGNGDLKIHYQAVGAIDTTYIAGTYSMINYRKVTIAGSIENGFPEYYCGNWRIIKLKKDDLIMSTEIGGLLIRDFVKL